MTKLVQIALAPGGGNLWLHRALFRAASSFRGAYVPRNFLPTGIKKVS
jgi:hypothetical protein